VLDQDFLLPSEPVNFEVIAYSYVIADVVAVQKTQPILPNKLSISEQAVNTTFTEPINEVLNQLNTLLRV
jgi:hypothetical protein